MIDHSALDEIIELIAGEMPDVEPLERRIAANKLRRALDLLDPPAEVEPVDELKPMTEGEAQLFGMTYLHWKKYEDTPIRDVPYADIAWLADTKRTEWRELHRYLLTRDDE